MVRNQPENTTESEANTMPNIRYEKMSDVNPDDFIPVLNAEEIRNHLVSHDLFDSVTICEWVKEKTKCGDTPGCRVRAIIVDNKLAGWCGIQKDNENYEIAMVISKSHWGIGTSVFQDLKSWAKELGHNEVTIHLLETRPEYRFLTKASTKSYKSKLLGRNFITYHVPI